MNQGGTEYPLHVQFANPTNESLSKTTGMPYLDEIVLCDNMSTAQVSVAYCPGDFYVYKPLTHPQKGAGYVTCKWRLSFKCFFQQMKRELEEDL